MQKYMDAKGTIILSALDEVSAKYQSSPATIVLAWLMSRPAIAAPIASATNTEQLKVLLRAGEIKLDTESINALSFEKPSIAV
jgi:aryl-alcohol dehydrogenase-like predicted oxidoreductase